VKTHGADGGNAERFSQQYLHDHPAGRLIILRGWPGSGKSTLAQAFVHQASFVHVEADQHFTRDGVYQFNPANASDAHAVCQKQAIDALHDGRKVIVGNTHVRLWELAPYVGIAYLLAVEWAVIECRGVWPNIHGVPEDVVGAMRGKFEPMPSEFAFRVAVWP
jgi:hypothetical protein